MRAGVARPLVEGLRTPTVVRDDRIRELLPLELTPFDEAARAALEHVASRNFPGEGVHRAGRRSSTGDNPKGGTMKYMLLIHQGDAPTPRDPEAWARLSEDEQKRSTPTTAQSTRRPA